MKFFVQITMVLIGLFSCAQSPKTASVKIVSQEPAIAKLVAQRDSFKINDPDQLYLFYVIDLKKQNLEFFWKDNNGHILKSFQHLKDWLGQNKKQLLFAMNGGMYLKDCSPQGLFIQKGQVLKSVNKVEDAYGNFYLQPNGIFYITNDHKGVVCKTTDFSQKNVKYATQSGPMLLIDGHIHPKFRQGSTNLFIRNGVGILPNGNILLALSKEKVNFFDFASFFKANGCENALYLDGFISKAYYPAVGWNDLGGGFGVILGVTVPK